MPPLSSTEAYGPGHELSDDPPCSEKDGSQVGGLLAATSGHSLSQSLSSSLFDLTPSQDQMTGRITGISCLEYADMTFAQCALCCYPLALCRVAYLKCESSSCFCVLCAGVEEIDFSVVDEKFFLNGRVLEKNLAIPS